MHSNYLSPHVVSRSKRLLSTLTAALALTAVSVTAQAQQGYAAQNLQVQAQESNSAFVSGQWTRVEFSKSYDDPVVVVETLVNNSQTPYMVGVRNIDAMGFEISLRSCDGVEIPLQESINFSVLENKQPVQDADQNRQVYAWGECPA
jgi:opacity protein-like surface antigen